MTISLKPALEDESSITMGLYWLFQRDQMPALFRNAENRSESVTIQCAVFRSMTLNKILLTEDEKNKFQELLLKNYRKPSKSTWKMLLRLPVDLLVLYLSNKADEEEVEDAYDEDNESSENVQYFLQGTCERLFENWKVADDISNLPANIQNYLLKAMAYNFEVTPPEFKGTLFEFSNKYGEMIDQQLNRVKSKKIGKKSKQSFSNEIVEEILPETMKLEELFDSALSCVDSKFHRKVPHRGQPADLDKVELNLTFYLSRIKDAAKRNEARQLIISLARLT